MIFNNLPDLNYVLTMHAWGPKQHEKILNLFSFLYLKPTMNYKFKYQAGIDLYITPPDLNYVLIMHAWRLKQHENFELIFFTAPKTNYELNV